MQIIQHGHNFLCGKVSRFRCAVRRNSRRLKEVAAGRGIDAYLVDAADEIDAGWLVGKTQIGVTAGASAPDVLVQQVVARLQALSGAPVAQLQGVEEAVYFPLPKELAG